MDINTFFKNNQKIVGFIATGLIVLAVVYLLMKYSNKEYIENVETPQEMPLVDAEPEVKAEIKQAEPIYSSGAEACAPVPQMDFDSRATVTPEDLLPKSQLADDFAAQFPVGAGDLSAKNFLTAGFNTGINTVASSLRNANLQIRSDPYIAPKDVTPFGQSTMVPDLNRKTLEIGS